MTKLAIFNLPARGHLNPTLPVVKELVGRGIEVHYFIGDDYRESVELVGSTFHCLPPLKRIGERHDQRPSAPDDRQIALMPFAMAHQAPQIVPLLVEELRSIEPDCVIYNTLSLWPRLAARVLDLPSIGFRPFHGPREPRSVAAPFASDRLAKLAVATDQGLSVLMSSFGKPTVTLAELVSQVDDLTLMFLLRDLQHNAEAFDERFVFVGSSLSEAEPEPWPFADDPSRNLRRAYVSLGTMRNDDADFYRDCFAAFTPDAWQVVMSVGNNIDLSSLTPVPRNFVVARSVQQTAVLPHVDVFVTHGGLNSVTESLTFGVPMLLVPSIKEQCLTAARVEALNCGIVLDRQSVTATSLLQIASTVTSDTDIQARLNVMQEKAAAAGGYKQAAEAIMNYVGEIALGN